MRTILRTSVKVYLVVLSLALAAQYFAAPPVDARGSSSFSSAPSAGRSFSASRSFSSPSVPRSSFAPAPAPRASAPTVSPAPAPKSSYAPAPSPMSGNRGDVTVNKKTTVNVYQTSGGGGGFFSSMFATVAGMWLFQSCNSHHPPVAQPQSS